MHGSWRSDSHISQHNLTEFKLGKQNSHIALTSVIVSYLPQLFYFVKCYCNYREITVMWYGLPLDFSVESFYARFSRYITLVKLLNQKTKTIVTMYHILGETFWAPCGRVRTWEPVLSTEHVLNEVSVFTGHKREDEDACSTVLWRENAEERSPTVTRTQHLSICQIQGALTKGHLFNY